MRGSFNETEQIAYRSKIIDLNEKELIIDYPVNIDEYLELPITANCVVGIEYVTNGNVYTFLAKVIRIINSPVTAFAIGIPKNDHIKKIQRREYVRINTDVNVAVHNISSTFQPFITVTRDISGGGVAIIIPRNIILVEGEMVQLYLVLKSTYSDFEYVTTKGEIIRTTIENHVRTTSLKFHFYNENDRQKIIKYCFEIQREKLKRQIL